MPSRIPRMKNPAALVPDAFPALGALSAAVQAALPATLLNLVYLRSGQINGSSWSTSKHAADLRAAGESDERLFAVAAWRDAPYFTDAERAALALAEAATRLADRQEPVPDHIWDEAGAHFTEPELAALLMGLGLSNLWHRLLTPTRQTAGAVG
ncbi:carboxymuconolactone decarboxylase family protein [Streptomyces sp. 8N114]|uniref:carboxymuconolactone decarboxylase family protein n=1 Tax=Streptomyces sp. 8N114 TaxID=3457419 RepID=UPI003FD61316